MEFNETMCIKCVGKCSTVIKYGKTKSGNQRYICKICGKTKVVNYRYRAYQTETNENIILLSLKKDTEINNFIKKNLTTDFKVKSLDKIIENFKLKEKENQKLYQSNISFEEKYKICIEEKELFINANNQVKKGVFN